jgi:hypothetical protein
MKNLQILFTLLLFCAFNCSFAQVKYPFPNKNGEWTVLHWGPEPEYNSTFKSFVEKDTVINNKAYSIIGHQDGAYVRCALRTDSLKVYALNIRGINGDDAEVCDTCEYVLYDYGLKVGDHFKVANYFEGSWTTEQPDIVEFEVWQVDSVKINEKYRRRLKLFGGMNDQDWIDGIGSSISPIYQAFMTEFENGFDLRCYRENGKRVFGYHCEPDFSQIPFPNKDGEWYIKSYHEGDQTWVYHKNPDLVEKDTIINNIPYSILKSGTFAYRCAIRSNYPKYYYIDLNHPERGENILYDFGLMKGETIELVHYNYNGKADTIQWYVDQVYHGVYGENSRLIILKNSYKSGIYPTISWWEGVGCTSGPMYLLRPSITGNLHELFCYKEDGYPTMGDCSQTSIQNLAHLNFHCSFLSTQKLLLVEGQFEQFDLMIVDTLGRLVFKRMNCCENQINLESLKKGYYIVNLRSGSSSYNQKIIIN